MRLVLVVVLLAGCSKSSSPCERAVHRVLELMESAGSKPGAGEQQAIDEVARRSIAACEAEGLSPAQADCIFAMKTLDDLQTVTKCPAIQANHPSWLSAGPRPSTQP